MENATDDVAIHTLELCAGVGMLGEGVRAAFEFLGIGHRTVCYVEREAAAAAQLVALMEAGALDAAPVWSDMLTFDGRRFRGLVDCVAAGFPCQDLSVAGRRAGLNEGTRSGLFFLVLDIADDSGALFLVLENVAGIASATASVVDEEEGDIEERAAARVLGELADRGWHAEWLTLSASDVGASHGRERWFCFAWRVADAPRDGHDGSHGQAGSGRGVRAAGDALDDAEHAERWPLSAYRADSQQGDDGGWREANCGAEIADAALGHAHLQRAHRSGSSRIEARRAEPALSGERMAYPEGDGRNEGRPESSGEQGRPNAAKCGGELADTRSTRLARGGGQVVTRPDGKSRMDMLDWRAEAFSLPAPMTHAGPESSASGPGSRRRLNPAFGCWLMGWPWFWTNPAITSSVKSEMVWYRSALQRRLSSLCGEADC